LRDIVRDYALETLADDDAVLVMFLETDMLLSTERFIYQRPGRAIQTA